MAVHLMTARIPEPGASSQGSGTVRSIDHARRRRRSSIAASGRIGVLIVAGDAPMRAGLRRLLDDDAGLTVLGEAANGSEAARQHSLTDADVVVLDAGRRESEAVELALALRGRAAVLLLTEHEAGDRMLAALRAGVAGVLPRDSHPADLASAVRTVANGGALLPPHTTRRLISELVRIPNPTE